MSRPVELAQLGLGFFAEISGIGLADVVESDEAYALVGAAFEEHRVLLFRRQQVTDELQAAYSRRFGPLETAKVASLGESTPYSILTNVDRATGALVAPDHKEALRARESALANRQLLQSPACARLGSLRARDSADRRRD